METLTTTITEENVDILMEEDAADSNDPVKPDVLHGIYGEEVFNNADDMFIDAPSPSNATQDTQLKHKRRRKRLPKFEKRSKGSRKQKGSNKANYTYQ